MATRRVSEEFTLYLAYASGYQEYPNSKSDLPCGVDLVMLKGKRVL